MKQAIAAPFKLDVCLKIADSQLSGQCIHRVVCPVMARMYAMPCSLP